MQYFIKGDQEGMFDCNIYCCKCSLEIHLIVVYTRPGVIRSQFVWESKMLAYREGG